MIVLYSHRQSFRRKTLQSFLTREESTHLAGGTECQGCKSAVTCETLPRGTFSRFTGWQLSPAHQRELPRHDSSRRLPSSQVRSSSCRALPATEISIYADLAVCGARPSLIRLGPRATTRSHPD
jgi:hypothetical protein